MGDVSDNDKTTDRTTDRLGEGGAPDGARPVDASSTTSEPVTHPGDIVEDIDDLDQQLDDAPGTPIGASANPAEAPADGVRGETPTEQLDLYALTGRAAPKRIEPLPQTGSYAAADADFAARDDAPVEEPAVGGAAGAAADSRDSDLHADARTSTPAASAADGADAAAPGDGSSPDAETTVAPPLFAGAAGAGAAAGAATRDESATTEIHAGGYGAEPSTETTVIGAPADAYGDGYPADEEDDGPDPRRGTLDFGLLLLRLGLGGMLLLHGLSTFFGFGGSGGIGQLQGKLADYAYASTFATAVPTVEVIAGGLLVLGLATPLGAALALTLSAFLAMHEVASGGVGWNVAGEGSGPVQLQLLLTAGALALQFTGPGRYGLDFSRRWSRRPLVSSWFFCVLAIAGAVAAWWLATGSLPFAGA